MTSGRSQPAWIQHLQTNLMRYEPRGFRVQGSVLFALKNDRGELERCSVQIDAHNIRVIATPDVLPDLSIALLQGTVADWEAFVASPSYQSLARLRIYGDVQLFSEFESSIRAR